MPAFERHVFVCTNQREAEHPRGCCSAKEAAAIREVLKIACVQAGLAGKVRINTAGCLDQCEHGPTVVIYPEAVWYGFVTPADIPEIIQAHLIEGRPVERLRLPDTCVNTAQCPHRGGTVRLGGIRPA